MKTRNARNFILGTISQLSADFNNLVIYLVEGNTRIAEREQFARQCYKLSFSAWLKSFILPLP